jgi:hypothetical protein
LRKKLLRRNNFRKIKIEGDFLLRKAQISQVFTYITAMLVIGLLIVFGYKSIDLMLGKQCDAKRVIFEKSLLEFIDEYSDYGSVHEEVMKTPCDAKEICFANATYCPNDPYNPYYPPISYYYPDADSVITAAVEDCKANIFIKSEFTETLMNPNKFSTKISLGDVDTFKCFKVKNSQVKLLFTGFGSRTKIEEG